jgi:hypothetical protein
MSEDIYTNNESLVEDENLDQSPETKVEELAEELGITASIYEDSKTVAQENNVIDSTEKITEYESKPGIVSLKSGAFGSASADKPEPKPSKKAAPKEETVAIHSTRNVTWSEVGKIYRGYNIVKKSAAEKWLTRDHVRPATPEEVAKEFGK